MLKIRLKEVLNQYGYTLYDLSDAILDLEGISESTVYRFARGGQNLTLKKLELILVAVRNLTQAPINLSDLIGDESDSEEARAKPNDGFSQSLTLVPRSPTEREVSDVWALVVQRAEQRAPKRRAKRWFIGASLLGLLGIVLLSSGNWRETQTGEAASGSGAALVATEVRVSQSSDDAEENVNSGAMYLDSSDLELIEDPEGNIPQVVGIRFQNVDIPQGAVISDAHIEFEVDGLDDVSTYLTIHGEAADSASTFGSLTNDISSRHHTSASVAWDNLVAWERKGAKHQTPNLAPIVQEIVNRPGWSPGNSMVFIVTGSGDRTAEAYDGESESAPLLRVEYAE